MKRSNFKKASGFTLMEVLLVLILISILMSMSIFLFDGFRAKTAFGELKQFGESYKTYVAACFQQAPGDFSDKLAACDEGDFGIPDDITDKAGKYADTIEVENGVITITPSPVADTGIDGLVVGDELVLTPSAGATDDILDWTPSGQGCDKYGCI